MKQNNQILLTDTETARSTLSAVKSNSKARQFAAEARAALNRAGRWRHLHLSAACLTLAFLAMVGAGFAPPGVWPSIWGIAAGGLTLLALFWAFEYDPHQLARIVEDLDVRVKQDAVSADTSSRKAQDDLLVAAHAQVDRYVSAELAAGTGFTSITEALAKAAEPVLGDIQLASGQVSQKRKTLAACEKELSDLRLVLDHRVARWWPSRLWPAFIQTPARKVVSAIERTSAARLELLIEQLILLLHENVAALMTGAHASKFSESGTEADSLARRLDAEWKDALKAEQIGAPCLKLVPKVSEIEQDVAAAVGAALPIIRKAIACRSQDQSVENVVQDEARKLVAGLNLPQNWGQWFSRRNGDKSAFLEQLHAQATEQAITEPTPGQESIRVRVVLVPGGTASAAFKDITTHSPGMFTHALHHQDELSCVVLTVTDMVPIGSDVEYLKAIPASLNLSKEKRAAAIVAVDPSAILGFTPERGQQASDALRVVCLGLVFGLIERTKAERYREVDPLDPDKEPFAAGFDQCLEICANDNNLADRIQQKIETVFASQGAEALRTRLSAALQSKVIVPSSATKRFREALSQEMNRLDSPRSAQAA